MAVRRRPAPGPAGAPEPGRAATAARQLALRVLLRVQEEGAFADLALRAALDDADFSPRERALATELVYGTLRRRGQLDFLLARVADTPLAALEPEVLCALRMGAYQIACLERIPERAAVDETVRGLRDLGLGRAAGFANAVLRRLAERWRGLLPPALDDDPVAHLRDALSVPEWLAERWVARFGPEEAAALAQALLAVPPRCARANRARTSRDALLAELRPRFPEAAPCRFAPDGIRLGGRGDAVRDPAFAAGLFTVQDEASQLVVELLDPQPGERVLDACAAPGTKSTAIAERLGAQGRVVALDRHARRLALVERDAQRLGLPRIETRVADLSRPLPRALAAGGFDRVLVDAPCSGLGTLRRTPELRWRVAPTDCARLAEIQFQILRHAAAALRPGGALVYSVCTFTPEENEAVVDAFLAREPGFRRSPVAALPASLQPLLDASGALRTWPHRHDSDAFFAARLERGA
jgi:16S rRNA (cytosine967-C5)-methyltransferase